MQGMLRQAQKMQEEMEALRAELDLREYEVNAGGGMVTVKINGKSFSSHRHSGVTSGSDTTGGVT